MFKPLIVATTALMMASCASIVSDSSYPVMIKSNPSDTAFKVKDEYGNVLRSGRTPMTVDLDASDSFFSSAKYVIEYTNAQGVVTKTPLTGKIDGWYFGNIFFGGLIGMLIVDPATGAMYKLPEQVMSDVSSDTSSLNNKTLKIASIDTLSEVQKEQLIALK